MTEPSSDLFRQACGASGLLRLAVERPAGREAFHREFDRPFALVGREPWADLTLDDPAVSRRHTYLQVIADRVFCIDLDSRSGTLWDGQPRRSGWLDPDRPVEIGPFAVRLDGTAAPPGPDADQDPLASRPPDQDPLPAVALEVVCGDAKGLVWRMNRVLALVGQSAGCKVRVQDWGVGLYHCALLRTPLGLWVVDLLGSGGTSVNRAPVRWVRLGHGDELLVGDTLFGVRYDRPPGPAVPPDPEAVAVSELLGEAGPSEADQLRAELETARAEAEALRGQVVELKRSAAGLAEAREALEKFTGERADAEQRWQAELDAARTEVADREQRAATEAAAIREELEAAKAQATADVQQREELDAARAEAEKLREELERDRESAAAEADRLLQEADAARKELEAARSEAAAEAGRLRAESDAARVGFDRDREASQAEGDALRAERDQAGERAEAVRVEAEALRARVTDLEGLVTQACDSLDRADAEQKRLREELESAHAGAAGEADRLAAELTTARAEVGSVRDRLAELEQSAAEERTRAEAGQKRHREDLDGARAEAEGLRAALTAAQGEHSRGQESAAAEADRLRQEADELREERDRAREQVEAVRAELEDVRTNAAAAERRWQAELDAAPAAATGEADNLRNRVSELERSAAEAAKARDALDKTRWEDWVRWEAERQELRTRLQDETKGREADRRAAAEALDAARAKSDSEGTEALRAELEASRAEAAAAEQRWRAELDAARAAAPAAASGEVDALRARVGELQRSAAEAEGIRAELTAARKQLDDERAARQADAGRLRREIDTLRQEREMLAQKLEGLPDWLDSPAVHGIDLGPAPRAAGAPPRTATAGPGQPPADAARTDLQRQLAEVGRQLQEARDRAARLEAELRGRQQQYVTLRVQPVPLPPDKGGAPRG
jgi:pSer/pThr/pTyr-binding forkhead associated (FHA) protein